MNWVLYPTDFTEFSINAFDYALDYAINTNSKLIVFHAYTPDGIIRDETQAIYDVVDIENFRNKKDKFPLFEQKLHDKAIKNDVEIKYIVKEGDSFIESLTEYVDKKESKIEIIIVGAENRKNTFLDMFFEPKTLKLLNALKKPVLAVPSDAIFEGPIKNFAFLVDYNEGEKEILEELIHQIKLFDSKLHVLHFDLSHTEDIVPMMSGLKASFKEHHLSNVVFKSIDSIDIKSLWKIIAKSMKLILFVL